MKPARYIFLNKGLGMSAGKCAAQAAHAETLAMNDLHNKKYNHPQPWVMQQEQLWEKWFGDGHYAKYVMEVTDATQMFTIKHYLEERGFSCYLVVDEGHTENTYFVPTAMAVELIDKDDERSASIFGEFRKYKEKTSSPRKPSQPEWPESNLLTRFVEWKWSPRIMVLAVVMYMVLAAIFPNGL